MGITPRTAQRTARRIALAWESLGPSHLDRVGAVAASGAEVAAIEFADESRDYRWERDEPAHTRRITLCRPGERLGQVRLAWRLFRAVRGFGARAAFLCHYQEGAVFLAALLLRLTSCRVYAMIDSKFDDYPRVLWREAGKAFLLSPYDGALVGSRRTGEYMHFLGFRRRRVIGGFDALDLARIRRAAPAAPDLSHQSREFLIVARLVPKKNLPFALRAYAAWAGQAAHPRKLRIIGYGAEEEGLRALAAELSIADQVVLTGPAASAEVYAAMRAALCLILPSTEEQFGLVVTEALALGLPVLVSANAGAVDGLVDNGVNGWIIDPYRPAALVAAMALLDRDEAVWKSASAAASASAERGDVRHFVDGVRALLGPDNGWVSPAAR